jgi:hypothetical protein
LISRANVLVVVLTSSAAGQVESPASRSREQGRWRAADREGEKR